MLECHYKQLELDTYSLQLNKKRVDVDAALVLYGIRLNTSIVNHWA